MHQVCLRACRTMSGVDREPLRWCGAHAGCARQVRNMVVGPRGSHVRLTLRRQLRDPQTGAAPSHVRAAAPVGDGTSRLDDAVARVASEGCHVTPVPRDS